ncbi:MAG: Bax inhibitor-1/YccA family protein [bacterium]|nr:Bax inhibitor-1/YccA family protein [bacterium]
MSGKGNPFMTVEKLVSLSGTRSMTVGGTFAWLGIFTLLVMLTGGFTLYKGLEAYKAAGFDFSRVESVEQADGESKTLYRVNNEDGSVSHVELPKVDLGIVTSLTIWGTFVGFMLALIVIFNPTLARFLGPVYAICEGFALGGISAVFEAQYPGIAMQAVAGTAIVMILMFFAYGSKLIRPTQSFMQILSFAMTAILVLYLADIVLTLFGGSGISIIHSNGPGGIALSFIICVVAAFNFIVDFETINEGVRVRASAEMEAYAAFGVLLTLVWLYLEILRLLAKLRSND